MVCLGSWLIGSYVLELVDARRRQATVDRFLAGIDDQVRAVAEPIRRPLHDIRPLRRALAMQLGSLTRELGLDRAARPRAATAVGRLYAALGDDTAAVRFFDSAWEGGPSADTATARAAVYTRLILRDVVRRRPVDVSGTEPTNAEPTIDEPTAEVLRGRLLAARDSLAARPGGAADEAWWHAVDAALAQWDGEDRLAAAAATARAAQEARQGGVAEPFDAWSDSGGAGWAGQLELRHGDLLWAAGDGVGARSAWQRAEQDLRGALETWPSDLRLYRALCASWVRRLHAAEPGTPAPFSQAEASCQDGLRVDADDLALLTAHSWVDLAHARRRLRDGADPRPFLDDSRRKIERIRRQAGSAASPWASMVAADERDASALEAAWASTRRRGAR